MNALLKDKDFLSVVKIFIVYKLFVISIAVGTQFIVPAGISHTEHITDNVFLNPFAQYDSTAYLYIAENGYTNDFGSSRLPTYHWYPLYPLLIKILGFVGYDLAAFIITNVASFFAILFLFFLIRDDVDKKIAKKSVFYFLFFPTAYYLTVMYAEALLIAFATGAFYFAKKERWAIAGILGFFAALSRVQGILLFLPLLYIYLKKKGFDFKKGFDTKKLDTNFLFVFLIPLGTFAFAAYEYTITGDFFVQFKSWDSGGKPFGVPLYGYIDSFNKIFLDTTLINVAYHAFNIFLVTSFIFIGYVCWKKLGKEYSIYFIANFLVLMLSSNFYGIPRHFLAIFPAFMVLPLLEKNRKLKYTMVLIYATFILMSAVLIALHVTERFDSPILYTPLF